MRVEPDTGARQDAQNNGSGAPTSTRVVEPERTKDLIGTQSYTFPRTRYRRELSLRAITFDLVGPDKLWIRKTGSLWTVAAYSRGSSPVLDEVLPVLVAGIKPYVGTHHDGTIVEKINGTSRRIKAIKDGS